MRAIIVHRNKRILPNGSVEEIAIWKLPEPTKDHPHGLKYRLYFGLADGTCQVRYDNEKGKGDHKHILDQEEPYVFVSIERLIEDFLIDIKRVREKTL